MHNIEPVLEELLLQSIIPHTEDIKIGVRYYKADKCVEMDISYGGDAYNPYDGDDVDVLSMLLVRSLTTDVKYEFGGRNNLSLKIEHKPIEFK